MFSFLWPSWTRWSRWSNEPWGRSTSNAKGWKHASGNAPNMPGGGGMNMMNSEMHSQQEAMMMSNQMASMQGGMPPQGMMSEQMMARTYGQMSAQGAMMSSNNGNMMRMEGMASMAHQNSPPFPGGRENMMEMMHGGPMPGRNFGPGMERMSGQGHGPPMNPMGNYGPMSRQGGMRMSGPGNPNMPNMLQMDLLVIIQGIMLSMSSFSNNCILKEDQDKCLQWEVQ
ncbi:unnamed protein product [Mytilus edulis]|uniref:Uncharacterized protein n=1 Tax=Mytilus edulis TaxID=6550 RepID=A0A8S3T8A8_MYTED|nr:unnamed protein product [Mytilus edulis]